MIRNVLVIPDTRHGHGSGHLMRAARLVREFNEFPEALARLVVDFPWNDAARKEQEVRRTASELGAQPLSWADRENEWDAYVVDAQNMSREMVCDLSFNAPVIGIDLGGSGRAHADYLIDTMTNLEAHAPNRFEPGLNALPKRVRRRGATAEPFASAGNRDIHTTGSEIQILIAAGGEDPAGLTGKLLEVFENTEKVFSVDVVEGRFSTDRNGPERSLSGTQDESARRAAGSSAGTVPTPYRQSSAVRRVLRTDTLADRLGEYDIVITTFGLTSYEALAAGCTVIHVAPTAYHAGLSKRAGLPLAGKAGSVSGPELLQLIENHEHLRSEQEAMRPVGSESLAHAVRKLKPQAFRYERVEKGKGCGIRPHVVARFADRTYRNGRSLMYLQRFSEDTIAYNEDYFFDEYKAQYGRSYLEDFDHIAAMCRERMRRIVKARNRKTARTASRDSGTEAVASPSEAGGGSSGEARRPSEDRVRSPGTGGSSPILVDLGCAYGPMLRAAAECGYTPFGVDFFEGAVEYVRNTLGYTAVRGDIVDPATADQLGLTGKADVVTMWYVIEHIQDLSGLFYVVRRLLKPGGVLAFSTPNAGGGSAKRDLNEFLYHSPEDHWSVWDAQRTGSFLRRHGFLDCHVWVTGHHPERFAPRIARTRTGMAIMRSCSRLLRLGDTFEAYAIKDGKA